MTGFPGTEDPDHDACAPEHTREALRLRARVGMFGDMHDQGRRNAFLLVTWVTAEKSRCFAGSLPNFSRWPYVACG